MHTGFRDFKSYVQAFTSVTEDSRGTLHIAVNDVDVLAQQFLHTGAVPQAEEWCPCSAETAIRDFGSADDAGYYLEVIIDGDVTQFCINLQGTEIHYV